VTVYNQWTQKWNLSVLLPKLVLWILPCASISGHVAVHRPKFTLLLWPPRVTPSVSTYTNRLRVQSGWHNALHSERSPSSR
jgi:hypothetical protein